LPFSLTQCVASPSPDNDDDDYEEDSQQGSASDGDTKKGRRHALLRHKLTLSEGESADEKSGGKGKKSKDPKKRSWRKGLF
jgi:transcriptional regulator ATRX